MNIIYPETLLRQRVKRLEAALAQAKLYPAALRRLADYAKLIAETEAKLAAAEASLREQLVWHEERAKGLSKQPPAPDRDWRLMEHRDQMNELRAALATEKAK